MLAESILIHREVSVVYSAFADLNSWKLVLPDVLDVKVLYDDGYNQEFFMTVERSNGPETVRGIRFCLPYKRIELFQPEPPPGFKRMTGVWTFDKCDDDTKVVAKRWFELNRSNNILGDDAYYAAIEETKAKLSGYLQKNLGLFKTKLEEAK